MSGLPNGLAQDHCTGNCNINGSGRRVHGDQNFAVHDIVHLIRHARAFPAEKKDVICFKLKVRIGTVSPGCQKHKTLLIRLGQVRSIMIQERLPRIVADKFREFCIVHQ